MTLKDKLYIIIFQTNTKAGKFFDISLLYLILISVFIVIIESVPSFGEKFNVYFSAAEWFFAILFTLEYIIRIIVSPKPIKYIFSFWGLIDFVASIPTLLSLMFFGMHLLVAVRLIRLLRIFRILKMARYTKEANMLFQALKGSLYKITVFMFSVIILVLILGTLMYVVEGHHEGFNSIPESIYWAIVTITTVGYGDLVPHTVIGKFISSIIMIIGYAIIAVPTGIVTVEMSKKNKNIKVCPHCKKENNEDSYFCSNCGYKFNSKEIDL